jgi:hypothetical protein
MISAWRLTNPRCESNPFAGQLGFVAGIFHHILVQYPRQAEIFTTTYFYLAGNITFCIVSVVLDSNPRWVYVIGNLGLFNIAYVESSQATLTLDIHRAFAENYLQCLFSTPWNSYHFLDGGN